MKIVNRKPIEDSNTFYLLTTDPDELERLKLRERLRKNDQVGTGDEDFNIETSSTSCHVSDIIAISFGGLQSRFWMLRKHFNSMNIEDLQDPPFHAWECLTLTLRHRDIDLVI